MSAKTPIFFTGATGYIGGTVLLRLLEHHTFTSSEITALLRPTKADQIPVFESIGVKTVLGTNDDLELLEKQASQSEVVFTCSDADDVPACEAILRGLKKRHEKSGKVPILIHTSGTGVLADNAQGNYTYDTIWDDMNPDQLDTLPDTQPHRNVDLRIVAADGEGYVKTFIVLPSTIYSIARGKLVDLGIQNSRSIQIPSLIRAGLARGQGGIIGKGENKWPNIHIDDLAELYMILYDGILSGRAGHGREGLYFAAGDEHLMRDLYKTVAQALYELGKGKSPEPTPFLQEECDPNVFTLGTNSRCKANRARTLGWKPKYTTEDMLESVTRLGVLNEVARGSPLDAVLLVEGDCYLSCSPSSDNCK
ncbi:hypothetical protein F5I97DRAFT_1049861 [Phlebopus sp. FC_14]|nr:hypothetical protein F5I97DRAFT_1049861 [Phlebopus sp. FC_14]